MTISESMATKVLVVSTSGIINDGITSWIKTVFSAMDLEGLEVDVVAWDNTDQSIIASVKKTVTNVRILPNRKKDVVGYIRALRRLTKNKCYDVLHVCGSSGLMSLELGIAAGNGIPLRIAHSHNTTCQHVMLDKITRPLMLKFSNVYLACGTDAGRWLFGSNEFTVIPNGKKISIYRFNIETRQMIRESLALPADAIVIGHVGRFNKQKNHPKLLELFKELRNRSDKYRLVLIGDGDLLPKMKEMACSLNIEDYVSFLGSRSDVAALLNAMDCMVLPSLYEGLPNVVVEWQINGLPCIVSDSVTRECALTPLVRFSSLSESVSAWADAVETSLQHSCRERDSVNAASAVAEAGYDIAKIAETLRNLYIEGVKQ